MTQKRQIQTDSTLTSEFAGLIFSISGRFVQQIIVDVRDRIEANKVSKIDAIIHFALYPVGILGRSRMTLVDADVEI